MTILDKHRNKRHIIIIGAGLSGLMTALTLSRQNCIVHLFDPNINIENKNLNHQHILPPDGCHFLSVNFENIWQELVNNHGQIIRLSEILSHKFPKLEWTNKDYKTQIFSFPTTQLKKILLRETQKQTNIKIHEKSVVGLITESIKDKDGLESSKVKGVQYPGGEAYSDLVVDCRGRQMGSSDLSLDLISDGIDKSEVGETAVTLSREYQLTKLKPTVEYIFKKEYRVSFIALKNNRFQLSIHIEQRSKILPHLLNNLGFENEVTGLEIQIPELKDRIAIGSINVSGGIKNIFYRHQPIAGYLPLGDAMMQTHPIYNFGITSILKQLQVLTSTILAYSDKYDEGIDWIDIKKKIFGSQEMSSYYLTNGLRELNDYWQVVNIFEPMTIETTHLTSNYKKFLFYEKMIPIFYTDSVLYRDFLSVWWAMKSPLLFMFRPRLHYDWIRSEIKNLW